MRIPIAISVALTGEGASARTVTHDLGVGGFSALLASVPIATSITATLSLGAGHEVCVSIRPVAVRRRSGSVLVSFAFQDLAEPDLLTLQRFLTKVAAEMLAVRPEWTPSRP